MKIKFILFFLTVTFFTFGQKTQPSIKETVYGFEKAIIAKDTSLLAGVIAGNFSVSTTTWPASGRLLMAVFHNGINFEYIRLISDNPVAIGENNKKVRVEMKETGKAPVETYAVLNNENRIVYVNYIDQLFGKNRDQESQLQARVPISVTETGSILMTLRLNDHPRELCFLFDSGADGMAMTRNLADTLGLKVSGNQQTSVVGGNMSVSISSGNIVLLDTLKFKNQNIALFDQMRPGIDGIIGLNLMKAFITKFDLDKKQLSLYSFGKYAYEDEGETIEIIVPENIPLIPCSINLTGSQSVEGHFAFDTGADYYLLAFSTFVRKNKLLTSGFKPESQMNTVSFGKATPTFNGKCADFRINHIHLKDMPVSLQAGSNWDTKADGSLGVRFISRYNFTINLLDKEIIFSPLHPL